MAYLMALVATGIYFGTQLHAHLRRDHGAMLLRNAWHTQPPQTAFPKPRARRQPATPEAQLQRLLRKAGYEIDRLYATLETWGRA